MNAQSLSSSVSLKLALDQLEQKFEITISYLEEAVAGIKVSPISDQAILEEYFEYIEEVSNLKVHKIDERYYSISPKPTLFIDICGILKDQITGEPVAGALIMSGEKRAISDEYGYFQIEKVRSTSEIYFNHLSYEKNQIQASKLNSAPCYTIALRPDIAALNEVIVQNYITEGIEKKRNGALTLSRSQMKVLPGIIDADVIQGLQVIPGVYSTMESVTNINIRGGTHDQNQILWDGIRMYQSGHFFGLISGFNPQMTTSLNLFRNGTPAKWGESVSSVVDIKGPSSSIDSLTASVGVNLLSTDANLGIPIGNKTTFYAAGRHSVSQLVRTPTYDQYFERAFGDIASSNYASVDSLEGKVKNFQFYDLNLKLVYHPNKDDVLSLSLIRMNDNLFYQEKSLSGLVNTRLSEADQQSQAIGGTYEKKVNEKWKWSTYTYLSHYRLKSENNDLVNDQVLLQRNEVLDWQVKPSLEYKVNDKVNLSVGYGFNERTFSNADRVTNPLFDRLVREVNRLHTLYSEGKISVPEKSLTANIGLRYNYFETVGKSSIEPRLSILQSIGKQWVMELSGELKSQSAMQIVDLQNDFLGIERRRWILSNEIERPIQHSRQISLGLQYVGEKLLISLEPYIKKVSGIITSSQSFQNQFELVLSDGLSTSMGVEALLNYRDQIFSTFLSYSLARNMLEFRELIDREFSSNVDIRHQINTGLNISFKGFEFSIGLNWHSGNPYTMPSAQQDIDSNVINYEFPNGSNLSNYLRVDTSARYLLLINNGIKAEVGFSIWNVTNASNQVNRYYRLSNTQTIEEVNDYGLGFTPNLMFRINF